MACKTNITMKGGIWGSYEAVTGESERGFWNERWQDERRRRGEEEARRGKASRRLVTRLLDSQQQRQYREASEEDEQASGEWSRKNVLLKQTENCPWIRWIIGISVLLTAAAENTNPGQLRSASKKRRWSEGTWLAAAFRTNYSQTGEGKGWTDAATSLFELGNKSGR